MPGVGRVSVELHPEKGKLFIVRTALVRTFLRKSEKSNDLNCSTQRTPGYTVFRESTKVIRSQYSELGIECPSTKPEPEESAIGFEFSLWYLLEWLCTRYPR